MPWDNKYFEFDEPIRWFKAVGLSPSNTYVGRSQAIDTVHRPVLVEPGDQIHALVGGTFVVRADGTVECGRFTRPKHLFEKSYGGRTSDAALLEQMAKAGRCREIDPPAARLPYAEAREAYRSVSYPDCTGHVEPGNHGMSPLLRKLVEAAMAARLSAAVSEAGAKIHKADVGHVDESLECAIVVEIPNVGRIDVAATPTDRNLWVRDRGTGFSERIRTDSTEGGFAVTARNDMLSFVDEDDADLLFESLARHVEEIKARTGVRP